MVHYSDEWQAPKMQIFYSILDLTVAWLCSARYCLLNPIADCRSLSQLSTCHLQEVLNRWRTWDDVGRYGRDREAEFAIALVVKPKVAKGGRVRRLAVLSRTIGRLRSPPQSYLTPLWYNHTIAHIKGRIMVWWDCYRNRAGWQRGFTFMVTIATLCSLFLSLCHLGSPVLLLPISAVCLLPAPAHIMSPYST